MSEQYRLFYVSTRTVTLDEAAVDELAEHSAIRNREQGIVGALSYNGVNFGQILEGPATTVKALYQRIAEDPRHTGLIVVGEKEIEKPHYKGWHMKRIKGIDFDELMQVMTND